MSSFLHSVISSLLGRSCFPLWSRCSKKAATESPFYFCHPVKVNKMIYGDGYNIYRGLILAFTKIEVTYKQLSSCSRISKSYILWCAQQRYRQAATLPESMQIIARNAMTLEVYIRRFITLLFHHRKRGYSSYIVREVRSVRERERDGSDVTFVALKVAKNFAPFLAKTLNWWWILHLSLPKVSTFKLVLAIFLAKNLHLSFTPLEGHRVHTFRCQKRCAFRSSSRSSFCFCQMAWEGIEAPKQTIKFPAAPTFFSSKKMNQINTKKLLEIKKEILLEVALGE